MRFATPLRSVLPLALTAALLGGSAAPRAARAQVTLAGEPTPVVPARMAGIYRIVLAAHDMATQRMHLVVRLEPGGYTCVMLNGEKETPITDLRLEGDVIRGTAPTTFGRGDVVLAITEDGVTGTLTVGRTRMTITGERVG